MLLSSIYHIVKVDHVSYIIVSSCGLVAALARGAPMSRPRREASANARRRLAAVLEAVSPSTAAMSRHAAALYVMLKQ